MSQIFAEPGTLFAQKYRINEMIGSGGFSQVYRATQVDLERQVALKLLRPAVTPRGTQEEVKGRLESLSKRFLREARMVSQLRSPYTITVYDYGQVDELLFMSIEYIDGVTLSTLIEEQGAIEPRRVVKILRQVLLSLKEAHMMGIMHRDIKPQNIMVYEHLDEHDHVKLLDFGILKRVEGGEGQEPLTSELTEEGSRVGTPKYMAPEYIRTGEVSPASDIYALGLVAFNLLAGEHPIGLSSSIHVLGMQLDAESFVMPEHLDVSSDLRALVERMIRKDLSERYASAQQVLEGLDGLDEQGEYRRQDIHTLDVSLNVMPSQERASPGARPIEAIRTEPNDALTSSMAISPESSPHDDELTIESDSGEGAWRRGPLVATAVFLSCALAALLVMIWNYEAAPREAMTLAAEDSVVKEGATLEPIVSEAKEEELEPDLGVLDRAEEPARVDVVDSSEVLPALEPEPQIEQKSAPARRQRRKKVVSTSSPKQGDVEAPEQKEDKAAEALQRELELLRSSQE